MGCTQSAPRPLPESHGIHLHNATKFTLDIWVNGGGPVARVSPGVYEALKLNHVDHRTTRGGCTWSATTTCMHKNGRSMSIQISTGPLPKQGSACSTISVKDNDDLRGLMAIIWTQRTLRENWRAREQARAEQRRICVIKLQSMIRGQFCRRATQCFICTDDMPFAFMAPTSDRKCHRTCRGCLGRYVNNAIDEGKLYIRCPGEGCSHLMDPSQYASKEALAKYRQNMQASHKDRLSNEADVAFLEFCREHARQCPACGVLIWRYAGCDHMHCRCGHHFDWTATDAHIAVRPAMHATSQLVAAQLAAFRESSANQTCFDCEARQPSWVNMTFGICICIDCAGHHRHLGLGVRSMFLDRMSLEEVALLRRIGGNHGLHSFLEAPGSGTSRMAHTDLGIQERYLTPAAHRWRRRVEELRIELQADLAASGTNSDLVVAQSERTFAEGIRRSRSLPSARFNTSAQHRNSVLQRIGSNPTQAARDTDANLAQRLEALDRLAMMGFDEEQALAALDRHGNHVARAVMSLIED